MNYLEPVSERNWEIYAHRRAGWRLREIAGKYELSAGRVWEICRDVRRWINLQPGDGRRAALERLERAVASVQRGGRKGE